MNYRFDFYVLHRSRSITIINVYRNGDYFKGAIGRYLLYFRVVLGDLIVIRIITYRINRSASYGFRTSSPLLNGDVETCLRGYVLTAFVHRPSRRLVRYSKIKNDIVYESYFTIGMVTGHKSRSNFMTRFTRRVVRWNNSYHFSIYSNCSSRVRLQNQVSVGDYDRATGHVFQIIGLCVNCDL